MSCSRRVLTTENCPSNKARRQLKKPEAAVNCSCQSPDVGNHFASKAVSILILRAFDNRFSFQGFRVQGSGLRFMVLTKLATSLCLVSSF